MNLSTQDIHIMLSVRDMNRIESTSMDNLRQRMEKLGWELNIDALLSACETLRTKRMIAFGILQVAGRRFHIKDQDPLRLTREGQEYLELLDNSNPDPPRIGF